jgi:hypothetical protein
MPEAPPTANQFRPDPSGGFSRTVFETDESPDFKITIRDFSFPPDKQTHAVTLPAAAFIHLLSGQRRDERRQKTIGIEPYGKNGGACWRADRDGEQRRAACSRESFGRGEHNSQLDSRRDVVLRGSTIYRSCTIG